MFDEKLDKLREIIKSFGSVAVAFSGGVDSTFLLSVCKEVLPNDTLAVTAKSPAFPKRELNEAVEFCKDRNINQKVIESNELEIEGYRQNPPNRCYLCKKELFSRILNISKENSISVVCEGSNADDVNDYRPGLLAIKELNIQSPLRLAGLTKKDIRDLSKIMGLKTWNKQSFACLSSRFPYGDEINEKKLSMIDKAEDYLLSLGFTQVRVRIHSDLARIEVLPLEFSKILENRVNIYTEFSKIGFKYTSLDLLGYKMGSMNKTLDPESKS